MKESFENEWRKRLYDEEAKPPSDVWKQIEKELDAKKRRGFFWFFTPARLGVAAAVLLSLSIGYQFLIQPNSIQNSVALKVQKSKTPDLKEEESSTSNTEKAIVAVEIEPVAKEIFTKKDFLVKNSTADRKMVKKEVLDESVPMVSNTQESSVSSQKYTEEPTKLPIALIERNLTWKYKTKSIQKREKLSVPEIEAEPKEVSKNEYWVGLNTAVNPFNPNFEIAGNQSFATAAINNEQAFSSKTAVSQDQNVAGAAFANNIPRNEFYGGRAFQYGIELGKTVRKKWRMSLGLRLNHSNVSQLTNTFSLDQGSGQVQNYFNANYLAQNSNTNQVAFTSFLSENTQTFDFMQVPMTVMYTLPLGQHFGLEPYVGIAPDIFVQSITKGEGVDRVKLSHANSNFRALNLSSLAGLGLAYRVKKHWQFVLRGNAQRTIFSGTKGIMKQHPQAFGLNYGLRYQY